MESIESLNRTLFLKINADATTPLWQIHLATMLADYVVYLVPLMLLAVWLWGNQEKRNVAIKAVIIAMISLGVNQLVIMAWPHPRPFMIGLGNTYMQHAPEPSFPSDHATLFAAIGITFLLSDIRVLGLTTMLAGVAVALSRIFLGIHFPLDMVGALFVVCFVVVIVSPIWQRFGEQSTQMIERIYRKVLARPIRWGWIRN